MPVSYKGLIDAYQFSCECSDENFYEWIIPKEGIVKPVDEFLTGQICLAPAWYEKKRRWYFIEDNYDPINEEQSTWYAKEFTGRIEKTLSSGVKKYFDLENDENLLGTHGKNRPVILIKKYQSSWANPSVPSYALARWLCLPIFSYKTRHNQQFVLDDLCFNTLDRIYMPPENKGNPGLEVESAIQLEAIQMVNTKYLKPLKCMCNNSSPKMQRPFRISPFALKIVMYHFIRNFDIFESYLIDSESDKNQYDYFVDCVREYVNDTLADAQISN